MPRKPNPAKKANYNGAFPTALRELMRERGITQEQMKGILGLANRQSVTGYVDGSTAPTPEKIIALAEYFHVSADYLLGRGDLPDTTDESRTAAAYTGLTEKAVALLHEMNTNEKYFAPIPKGLVFHLGSWLPELASAMITAPSFVRLLKSFQAIDTYMGDTWNSSFAYDESGEHYIGTDETELRNVHFAIFESTEFLKMVIDEMYNTGKFFKAVAEYEQG